MMSDLKEKFSTLPNNDPLRLRILTILLKIWSAKNISEEFGCSWSFAKKVKDFTDANGGDYKEGWQSIIQIYCRKYSELLY